MGDHPGSQLTTDKGAHYLVSFLEARLGRTPVPAAGNYAEELLVKLRRPSGMTMATWCAHVREAYRRLQRALKRARVEQGISSSALDPDRPDPDAPSHVSSPSSRGTGRRGSKQTVPEPQPEREDLPDGEDDERWGEVAGSAGRGGGKGSGRRGRSPSSSGEGAGLIDWGSIDQGLPDVLPTELLGWLMLRRCGLSAAQRLNVLASIGNSLRAEDVERGLRSAEEDLRLQPWKTLSTQVQLLGGTRWRMGTTCDARTGCRGDLRSQ